MFPVWPVTRSCTSRAWRLFERNRISFCFPFSRSPITAVNRRTSSATCWVVAYCWHHGEALVSKIISTPPVPAPAYFVVHLQHNTPNQVMLFTLKCSYTYYVRIVSVFSRQCLISCPHVVCISVEFHKLRAEPTLGADFYTAVLIFRDII